MPREEAFSAVVEARYVAQFEGGEVVFESSLEVLS